MKILCEYTPCGPSYVRTGWGRVLKSLGHDFLFWRPEIKPAFDAFSEFEPDLFIGTTYGIDRAIEKCIVARPEMRVVLFASAWGDRLKDVDLKVYPLVVASEREKSQLESLKKKTRKPNFVFIHVTDRYLEGTMGGWRTIGIKPVGILNACDTFAYLGGVRREELSCDIGFVGGYWGYKARNLDRYILPLCHPSKNLNVKLFGNQPWPVAQYLGFLEEKDVRDLFVTATVCPNVSEPHSTDLGWDVIERPFKVLGAGGFCISDSVEEGREIFTSQELIMANTPQSFETTIRHFVEHPEERVKYLEAGRRKVLAEHTYFHRVAQMLQHLGMDNDAKRCLEMAEALV